MSWKIKIILYLSVVWYLGFMTGCVTSHRIHLDVPSLQEVSVRRIEKAIADKNPALAFQDLYTLEQSKSFTNSEVLIRLRNENTELTLDLFERAMQEEQFIDALSFFITMTEAGISDPAVDDHTEVELIKKFVAKEFRDDNPVAGLYKARRNIPLDALTDEELLLYISTADEQGDRGYLRTLLAEALERRLDVPEDVLQKSEETITNRDLITGTVTIWVDRGMRVQDGVGLPDRVIGSGFFIDKNGYLLTNYHVISSEVDPAYRGFSRLYVRLSETARERIPAKVVGWDPVFDIALLKVERNPSVLMSFEGGQIYSPGERIYAIGSPGGLENTITSGIISATGRRFLQMGDVLQVDVPINAGNSGGPLLDEEGYLIGVVYAGIQQFEGVNFAIPGAWVVDLIPRLYSGGRIEYSYLGTALRETETGLEIIYTVPGEPADRAGLRKGDIITHIRGSEITNFEDAQRALLAFSPGTFVKIRYKRNGESLQSGVAFSVRPPIPIESAIKRDLPENMLPALFGFEAVITSDRLLNTEYSILKVYSGSAADEIGLSPQDPFSIQKWVIDEENKAIFLQLRIRKRKAGFLQSGVQLGVHMETDNFL